MRRGTRKTGWMTGRDGASGHRTTMNPKGGWILPRHDFVVFFRVWRSTRGIPEGLPQRDLRLHPCGLRDESVHDSETSHAEEPADDETIRAPGGRIPAKSRGSRCPNADRAARREERALGIDSFGATASHRASRRWIGSAGWSRNEPAAR